MTPKKRSRCAASSRRRPELADELMPLPVEQSFDVTWHVVIGRAGGS